MKADGRQERGSPDPSRVYAEHYDRVLSYLLEKTGRREDAEDLCHTVFEKIFRSLPDYDAEKASLTTWIYRITHNTLTDYYRTGRVYIPLPDDLPSQGDIESKLIAEETLSRLAEVLAEMGGREKDIIIMRYYNGMSLTEISEKTGISYGMVRVLHKKALTILRRRLT